MKNQKDMPPKIYRALLKNNYKQAHKEYQQIKNFQNKRDDPICQKEDRFIPPRTKGNILSQTYIQKMSEKPERPHIKRIPLPTNLSSGVTVVTETKEVRGIRIGPRQKNYAHSAEKRRVRKKMHPENEKIFYFDDFNSVKQNQNDLATLRSQVRKYFFYNFFLNLEKI